jgi:hypothetical protein
MESMVIKEHTFCARPCTTAHFCSPRARTSTRLRSQKHGSGDTVDERGRLQTWGRRCLVVPVKVYQRWTGSQTVRRPRSGLTRSGRRPISIFHIRFITHLRSLPHPVVNFNTNRKFWFVRVSSIKVIIGRLSSEFLRSK